MTQFRYLDNPPVVGDIIGFTRKARNIQPGLIVKIGKLGNLIVFDLSRVATVKQILSNPTHQYIKYWRSSLNKNITKGKNGLQRVTEN